MTRDDFFNKLGDFFTISEIEALEQDARERAEDCEDSVEMGRVVVCLWISDTVGGKSYPDAAAEIERVTGELFTRQQFDDLNRQFDIEW